MTSPHHRNFWRTHLHLPLIVFVLLAATVQLAGLDQRLADYLYALQGGQWALQEAWITSVVIHKIGKYFTILIALLVLGGLLQSYFTSRLKLYRRELAYVLCAAGGGCALISAIKSISHVSCAWDFSRYGGDQEYATVFSEIVQQSGGNCFPAGHASGGYAWLAFYFLGMHLQSGWRWAGLGFALTLGLIFGISQQLRGAHFISHDVWTLGICWFFSLLMYRLILVGESPPSLPLTKRS